MIEIGPDADDGLGSNEVGAVVVLEEIGRGHDLIAWIAGLKRGDGDARGRAVGGGIGDIAEGDPIAVVGEIAFAIGAVALDDAPVEAIGLEANCQPSAAGGRQSFPMGPRPGYWPGVRVRRRRGSKCRWKARRFHRRRGRG